MASRTRNDGAKKKPAYQGPPLDGPQVEGLEDMIAKLQAINDYVKNDIGDVIGTEAVNLFKRNFEDESFSDGSKWASRKTKREGGTNGQKVLSKSGELADSIVYRVEGKVVIISSDKPYAEIHNEGGKVTVTDKMRSFFWAKFYEAGGGDKDKTDEVNELADQWKGLALAKTLTFPQRKFIGESPQLVDNITKKILKDLNRIVQ